MSAITIKTLTGQDAELHEYLLDLAHLRIEVFREFPYLYNGNLDYEKNYLATYLQCPQSVVLLALNGAEVIGASTGIPLTEENKDFQQPFLNPS